MNPATKAKISEYMTLEKHIENYANSQTDLVQQLKGTEGIDFCAANIEDEIKTIIRAIFDLTEDYQNSAPSIVGEIRKDDPVAADELVVNRARIATRVNRAYNKLLEELGLKAKKPPKAPKVATSSASSAAAPAVREARLPRKCTTPKVPEPIATVMKPSVSKKTTKKKPKAVVDPDELLWMHKEKDMLTPDDQTELTAALETLKRIAYKTSTKEEDYHREWKHQFEAPELPGGKLQMWLINPFVSGIKALPEQKKRKLPSPEIASDEESDIIVTVKDVFSGHLDGLEDYGTDSSEEEDAAGNNDAENDGESELEAFDGLFD